MQRKNMSEHTPAPTPNRAVYGFAWFLFFKTLFILYLFWAFVPEYTLEGVLGFTYFPNKYFALYIPILVLCALTVFAFLIYPPWNLAMQDDIIDLHTIRDSRTIRRCQKMLGENGNRCEQQVSTTNGFNLWQYHKYCNEHSAKSFNVAHEDEISSNESRSDVDNSGGYCDCVNKANCLLHTNPHHLKLLSERATVPSVCDLDIVDVCKQNFRNK